MALTIYGASDDLVEVRGHQTEEWSLPSSSSARLLLVDNAAGEGRAVEVAVRWTAYGTWAIEVIPITDGEDTPGTPMPWPVLVRPARPDTSEPAYAAVAEIDCPDTVRVTPMWDAD